MHVNVFPATMKSQKVNFGSRSFRKANPRTLFVSRRIQNLVIHQTALVRALRQIFLPAQIFGVLPLRLVENKVQICFVILLFSAAVQLTMSTLIFYEAGKLFMAGVSTANTSIPIFKDGTGALNYAEEAGKTITVLYIMISTVTFCIHRKKFDGIIRRLITVKILLSQFGLDCQTRAKWRPMLLHALIMLPALIELSLIKSVRSAVNLAVKLNSEIMVGSIIVFFIQLLYLVEEMLVFLNDQLVKMMSTPAQTGKFRQISVMSDCHHYLCSVCYFVNCLHSFPLVFLYLSIFAKLVVFIFKTIIVLATASAKEIIIYGAVLATYVARSWYVVYICARSSDQTKLFNKNLFEMILFDSTEETIYVKKLMLHLEMKREIEFQAKGFFTIDYSLLHSIAAVATSYLVILVQTSG